MLYHNLVNSDKKRFARGIILNQEKLKIERCWFANAKDDGMSVELELSEEEMCRISKEKWKKMVKDKINIRFQGEINERRTEEGKLRFLVTKGINSYLKQVFNDDARLALMIRLNMVNWIGGNYGVRRPCDLCGEEDTTEHVFACNGGEQNDAGEESKSVTVTVKDLENGQSMRRIIELFRRTEEKRKEELLEDIVINCVEMCNEDKN